MVKIFWWNFQKNCCCFKFSNNIAPTTRFTTPMLDGASYFKTFMMFELLSYPTNYPTTKALDSSCSLTLLICAHEVSMVAITRTTNESKLPWKEWQLKCIVGIPSNNSHSPYMKTLWTPTVKRKMVVDVCYDLDFTFKFLAKLQQCFLAFSMAWQLKHHTQIVQRTLHLFPQKLLVL